MKTEKTSKKVKICVAVVLTILFVVVFFEVCIQNKTEQKEKTDTKKQQTETNSTLNENDTEQTGGISDDEIESLANVEPIIEKSPDLVVPGDDTLNINKILGFTIENENIDCDSEKIKVLAAGKYSGTYIEDGSDEAVTDVSAIIVINYAEEMVQYAEITFDTSKDKLTYVVTNLPGNTATMVMEQNKSTYDEKHDYSFASINPVFVEQSLNAEKIKLTAKDGKITATNISDEDYENVYIYYKYYQAGGLYFGGITYRTTIEDLKAGETKTSDALHYNEDTSLVLSVTYTK